MTMPSPLATALGAFLLLVPLVVELAARDVHAIDARHRVAGATIARVGLDAPGGEGDRDEREENLQDEPVLLYEIEHEGARFYQPRRVRPPKLRPGGRTPAPRRRARTRVSACRPRF